MTLKVLFRRPAAAAILTACCVLATNQLVLAQKKFLIFGDKGVSYKTYRDAAGRFELEYPTKDWSQVPAGGSTVAILARNDRTATVVIDLTRLSEPLAPAEVATNAEIEVETLKEQQPNAKNFKSEIVDSNIGHASLIRYARVGATGPERVMRYSIAVGQDLFHLDAIAAEASMAKHEPILMHMFQSFKVPANPAGSKN
jgi:photosystem II reaction center protein PsbP